MACFCSKVLAPDLEENEEHWVKNGTIDVHGRVANKLKTGKWPGSVPMLAFEMFMTIIFFSIISNLVNYMTSVLHQQAAKSASDLTTLQGTLFTTAVVGAFISDTYWGRYKTLSFSSIIYFLGLAALTISASVKSLSPPPCAGSNNYCPQPTAGQAALFYLALYMIGCAAGSMTVCVMSFGADQFDDSDEKERQEKSSFFNWLLCSIHAGGLIGVTVMVYIEDHVGYGWGFGILIIFVSIAMIVFFVQTPRYRYRMPEGSPLTKVAQVLVAAFRKRRVRAALLEPDQLYEDAMPAKGKRLIPHTNQFRFLDNAAVKVDDDNSSWKLSTVTRVEEVKLVIRMLPVWLATLWFNTAPSQTATFFVRQGMVMNNRLGSFKFPPASMLLFNNLGVLLFIPVYDYLVVPALQKVTKKERGITILQRIGIGIASSIFALVIAALVETWRKKVDYKLSIFWLVPQYLILGLAEGIAHAGMLEFFHGQAPDTMHSLGLSFGLASLGVGNYLSSVLVGAVSKAAPSWLQNNVNQGHIDYYYWLLAGLSLVNLVLYVPLSYWYSYKKADDYAPV